MTSVLVLSTARASQGRRFFPLDKHVICSADARGVFCHPASSAHWKTFEGSGADVPINASSAASRGAIMGGTPIEDGLAMDVVEEGGRLVRREFAIA